MHSGYLNNVFIKGKRKEKLAEVEELIKGRRFDGFLVRGVSGIAFGAMLAARMDKDLVVMRKRDEVNHADGMIEYGGDGRRLILIDDLICTGSTIQGMHDDMEEWCEEREINIHIDAIVFYNYAGRQDSIFPSEPMATSEDPNHHGLGYMFDKFTLDK